MSAGSAPVAKPVDYYAKSRPELARLVPDDATALLDVGCAEGVFGGQLKSRRSGLEVWGIEPVPAVAARARSNLDRVIAAPVEEALAQLPDAYFGCVTFNDCLEHLVDPWLVLRAIRRTLKPNGCVVASLPNLRFFPVVRSLILHGEFAYADEGVLDRTHLRFFTKAGMHRLFEDSGYRVEHLQGIHSSGLPFWFSQFSKLVGRRFHDMEYLQFAVRARPQPVDDAMNDKAMRTRNGATTPS